MSTLVPKKEDIIKVTPARQALKQFTGRDYVVNGLEASYSGLTINLTAGSVILAGCYIEYSQSVNIIVPANSSGFIKCRIVTNSSNEPINADIIQETYSSSEEFKLTLWQYTSSSTTITSLTDLRPKRITAKRELITSSQSLYKRNCFLYVVAVGGGASGTGYSGGHGGPVLADYTCHHTNYITITVAHRSVNSTPNITTVTTSFESLSTSPAQGGVFVTYKGVTATNPYGYSGDMKTISPDYVLNLIIENPQLFISGFGTNNSGTEAIIFKGAGFLGSASFLSTINSVWEYGKGGDAGNRPGTDGAVLIYSWEDLY